MAPGAPAGTGAPPCGGGPQDTALTGEPRSTAADGEPWDVAVIGGGNAGLVAAITARRWARRVLIVERAQAPMRGGNTRHTRNIRCAHDHADGFTTGPIRSRSSGGTCAASAPGRAARSSPS